VEGLPVSARKANQPQLTKEQIVSATMKLIDEKGLEGHSMRQLGTELGVDASTIYYYIPSKSALYSLIVDEVMSGADLSIDDPSLSIEDRLVAAAREYRRALLLHPRALPLVGVRSMRTPAQLRGVEILLGIFFDAGFSANEAVIGTDALGQTVIGMTTVYAAHITSNEYHADDEAFGELPPEEFPNVTRMLAEGAYMGFDVECEATVRALVTGLLAKHEAGTLVPDDAVGVGVDECCPDYPATPGSTPASAQRTPAGGDADS
jgi:TetR/AcrR family tetracycline transcriptional repressor